MIKQLPAWLKQEIPDKDALGLSRLFFDSGVHTVCKEARCPNASLCFKHKQATFMILGRNCTRHCRFCYVEKTGFGASPDENGPERLVRCILGLGLSYVVITSVCRDDLADGGSEVFARVVELIRSKNKEIKIELLIPDFQGRISSLKKVTDSQPECLAHNLETVARLYPQLRPQASYTLSLGLLQKAKALNHKIITKSSLMLGLGETEEEVICAMRELRDADCDILTLGQYLAPSAWHYPVREFIQPSQFARYEQIALTLGFNAVSCGPKVRSSYQAEELFERLAYAKL